MKRGGPKRNWKDARKKVEEEGRCRICGRYLNLEAAHIMGREYDKPKTPNSKTLWVDPDSIVPLCGPFPAGCHGGVDYHRIDLLPYLNLREEVQAVEEAGGIEQARRKLAPSAYWEAQ